MNADVKVRWVERLRSGGDKQGRGALRQDNAFCCLGVLCDIYAQETGTKWVGNYDRDDGDMSFLGAVEDLPTAVCEWAGLDTSDPYVTIDGEVNVLAVANDAGSTFAQIADLIEEGL